MENLVYIRYSINIEDEFYTNEQGFLDENMTLYQNVVSNFYKALVESKFRDKLEKNWDNQRSNRTN